MHTVIKLSLFLFIVVANLPKSHEAQTKTLFFLTILPYPDPTATIQPFWDAGPDLLPAAELAVDLINNRTDLLEGYQLELIHDDGGCDIVAKTVISFVRQILVQQSQQPIVGVIGGGCSDSSLTLSSLFAREAVSLINMHLGSSPLLGSRTLYPNTFGAAGSSHVIVDSIFTLMNSNNWQQIAVLYDESATVFRSVFLQLKKNIERAVPGGEITFSSAVYTTDFPLPALRESFSRVIVVATPAVMAHKIMCLAYHEGMLFPAFQWILVFWVDFTATTDFKYEGRRYNCSTELMSGVVLQGNLMVVHRLSAIDPSSTTAAGISYSEYLSMYEDRIVQYNKEKSNPYRPLSPNIWAPVVFDEVWALALALNNSNVDLSSYQYGQKEMTSVIRNEVYNLDFEGVSGLINFDTGFSTRCVNIFQTFSSRQELIASYNGRNIVNFSNAEVISDRFEMSVAMVSAPVVAVFAVVTLVLLCLIGTVHVITLNYRSFRVIKATSPLLNQFIYVGCYISVVGMLLYYLYRGIPLSDESAGNVCHAVWVWIIPVAYILIIGTIIARTWRLYCIFKNPFHPGHLISDTVLSVFVLVLLCVYVMIGAAWTAIDPLRIETVSKTIVAKTADLEIVRRTACQGSQYYMWTGIVSTYLTLIMIAMVVLSLLTMKIDHKNFTTKSIRVLAYLLAFISVLCIPVYVIMAYDNTININLPYIVLSIFLNSVIFLCFALVFIPPILALMRGRFRLINMLYDHLYES